MDKTTTIAEAQAYLRQHWDEGAECPCCTRRVQVYRRKLNSQMARALIALYRAHGLEWGHMREVLDHAGIQRADEAKLAYWNLIAESVQHREDGGRPGLWRVTPKGKGWLLGHSTVPAYGLFYDGRCLGLEGPEITIAEALGTRFSLAELLGRIA